MKQINALQRKIFTTIIFGMLLTPGTLLALPPGSGKVVVSGAEEVVEMGMKYGGKKILTQAERQALEEQVRKNVMTHGDDVIDAAKKGTLGLGKSGLSHSDEMIHYAQKSPTVARALEKNPDVYSRLLQEHGDDILLIEEKAAGMAPAMAKTFSREELHWVATKVPARDIPRLTAFAEKAADANTRQMLLRSYGETAGRILDKLDAKKIMALGLGAAMITASHETSDGLQQSLTATGEAIKHISEENPELLDESIGAVMMPATSSASIVAFILSGGLVFYLFRKFPTRPKGKTESLVSKVWGRLTGKHTSV